MVESKRVCWCRPEGLPPFRQLLYNPNRAIFSHAEEDLICILGTLALEIDTDHLALHFHLLLFTYMKQTKIKGR